MKHDVAVLDSSAYKVEECKDLTAQELVEEMFSLKIEIDGYMKKVIDSAQDGDSLGMNSAGRKLSGSTKRFTQTIAKYKDLKIHSLMEVA